MSQPWGYERGHPWGCEKEEEEMDEAILVIDCVKGRETGYGHGGRGWRHGRGACSGEATIEVKKKLGLDFRANENEFLDLLV
ncbi:hypothetical protein LOK49_LG07G00868 [Camellia lanceoleosa]|uniref:Uncharacterized protein n=1 Tax=Camellia lanceoleosa TaxID=1840588 RepID=A0ACC0H5F7_9ERIC|nr:hypothetical protein LOK49_LG07G00868 [Camellia lanceoleosa]